MKRRGRGQGMRRRGRGWREIEELTIGKIVKERRGRGR